MQSTITQSANRILIADDEPVVRHLIASVVKQQGYTPVPLSDGREVCRLLKSDANFILAILDMSMPYLTGIDLIGYMQTEKRLMRIPILMVTAEENIKLLADSFAAGATAFLPKPFALGQLQTALRMLTGQCGSTSQAA